MQYGLKSQERNGSLSMAFRGLWRRTGKLRSTEQSQVAAINRKKYTIYRRNVACVIQKAVFSSSVPREQYDLSDINIKYNYYS